MIEELSSVVLNLNGAVSFQPPASSGGKSATWRILSAISGSPLGEELNGGKPCQDKAGCWWLEALSSQLNRDFPEHGLVAGDVGTVVHRHGDGSAFEVELLRGDIRPMQGRDVLHVRSLAGLGQRAYRTGQGAGRGPALALPSHRSDPQHRSPGGAGTGTR